jgi:hypothetical protein
VKETKKNTHSRYLLQWEGKVETIQLFDSVSSFDGSVIIILSFLGWSILANDLPSTTNLII